MSEGNTIERVGSAYYAAEDSVGLGHERLFIYAANLTLENSTLNISRKKSLSRKLFWRPHGHGNWKNLFCFVLALQLELATAPSCQHSQIHV